MVGGFIDVVEHVAIDECSNTISEGLLSIVSQGGRKKRIAKLEHYIPTATDSILCDYVLVMVRNKKTLPSSLLHHTGVIPGLAC